MIEAPGDTEDTATHAAPRTGARGRERLCAVTRAVRPEAELIRFVCAPDGTAIADLKANLPGRGVWVTADRNNVALAVKRNVFRHGLKADVTAPADLPDRVAARLREAALGRLGLARKAGAVLAGFAKVEAAVGGETLAALVIAADAADDGRRKMEQAVFRRFGASPPMPVLRLFRSQELDLATGRPNVIHAAVLHGPAGRSFVDAVLRLQRFEHPGLFEPGTRSDRAGEDMNGAAEPAGSMHE